MRSVESARPFAGWMCAPAQPWHHIVSGALLPAYDGAASDGKGLPEAPQALGTAAPLGDEVGGLESRCVLCRTADRARRGHSGAESGKHACAGLSQADKE